MALTEKGILKVKGWVTELGPRKAGLKLIDYNLGKLGVSSSDLPDTATLANGLDEIENLLNNGEFSYAFDAAKETSREMLEDEGFPGMYENKQIKENTNMKRVKFKNKFTSIDEALTKVPNTLKKDKNVFEMTDGNKTLKVRWEGTLTEGKAVALLSKDETLINEDVDKMKHLMGYSSQKTIGNHKAKARVMENKVFKELLSVSKKKTIIENSGNIEIVDEAEILDEGLKSIVTGIMLLAASLASGQKISPEKVETIKTELSQLSPEEKEIINKNVPQELSREVKAQTGISFTDDASKELFKWEPDEVATKKAPAPKLYLGGFGDIKAAKVIKVSENGMGGYDYIVQISGIYEYGSNFNKIRSYIGKNNTKLKDITIKFVNGEGSPYNGKDITYK